ncbi:MAG TPA: hypothetical protein VES03_09935 [Motilibacterales bacterium]|nr:hypothetical protein [Motilibacterales bacterium]
MEGRAAQGRGSVGFRPPLTSALPVIGVLIVLGMVLPSDGTALFVVLVAFGFAALRLRQLLVLREDHLEVTVLRTRRIPWADIQGFESGTTLRGGTQIQTTAGVVHSIAPCSWWGGPADAADIEVLRREARARA